MIDSMDVRRSRICHLFATMPGVGLTHGAAASFPTIYPFCDFCFFAPAFAQSIYIQPQSK